MRVKNTTGATSRFKSAQLAIFALLMLAMSASARALTLKEAVELAMRNDPAFLAAQANLNASRERAGQAVAGLLPQLAASANATVNRRRYTLHTNPSPTDMPAERYNSNSAQLNLTQPLWRHGSMIAVAQADLAVSQADFQLSAAAQDMLVRLAQAWFDVMQARDEVMSAEAQAQTAQRQMELSQRGHGKGVLSLTELEGARAKYGQAIAERAAAQSELEIKLATLEQIIGTAEHTPPILSDQFAPPPPGSNTPDPWLAQAEAGNPTLLAAQRALDAASEEVRKQQAGHEPTLDLVASYGKSVQEAGISSGQPGFDSRQSTVGLQFNMPLYAGGGQNAKVREALALRDRAAQELEGARRKARFAAKQAWLAWRTGQARETSARQAVHSAKLALSGAQSARARGVKTDLDVLQAQQQNAAALRDWRKARYDAITNRLKLKAACGQLSGDDLSELDEALDAAPGPNPASQNRPHAENNSLAGHYSGPY
ncbi:MAG: type I secretion protein TolC [Gallionella sp.]|nr:MAG: type I secretion protein TolC [Gallionella sp.]